MLFTDTLGDVNGVCRFIGDMAGQARRAGRDLTVVTSTRREVPDLPRVWNFSPRWAFPLPGYADLDCVAPPARAMLAFVRAQRPDVIHVSTPGPVGVCGLLAAKMLRAPVVGVYHTDFPAYVERLFGDEVYTHVASWGMRRFYRNFDAVFSRSAGFVPSLEGLGLAGERLVALAPGVDLDAFRPSFRSPPVWEACGVGAGSVKVLYVGRVSVEKNLPLLARAWPQARRLAAARGIEAELVVVGDGPYREEMAGALRGEGAHFLGFRHGVELSRLYASSDLFVFPSFTDTLGQVVLEAQASGLAVLVSDRGGPQEVVAAGASGLVISGGRPRAWAERIAGLVTDAPRRAQMGRAAAVHAQRFSLQRCFEQFWGVHEDTVHAERRDMGWARAAAM